MNKFKYSYRSRRQVTVNGIVYARTLYDAYGMVADLAFGDALETHSIVVKPDDNSNGSDYEPPSPWRAFTVLLMLGAMSAWAIYILYEFATMIFG